MPESVRAALIAPGPFDGVTAAAAGRPLVFAVRTDPGGTTGRVWDAASGVAIGAPIAGVPEPRAFGLLPDGPALAWSHRDRIRVLAGGGETVLEPERATPPELIGLVVHGGRGAVAAVFGPARDAEVVVWDAASGDRLAAFGAWLGDRTALDGWILHAPPGTGPLIGLARDTDRGDGALRIGLWDVERGEEIGRVPGAGDGRPAIAAGPDGPIIVQPADGEVSVRAPGGPPAVLAAPGRPEQVAAVWCGGRLLVAADVPDDPGTLLTWCAPGPTRARRVRVPGRVNDFALAADGALVVATDEGLHRIP
ncbi:hypothetical protein [Spirillospora albida]|uniref:hypothetical protein n=1 Tax=Spirillospora albida TaxID=58123 RepID=UPI0004C25195|nr:hypothetical protein [Spirillospora albida]